VADQQGVELEHIVQDAQSDDGTLDWLPQDRRVKAFVEKDSGMYDAINRGWHRADGDVLAYLNCDEQYLPGSLKAVADCFASRPQTDVVFADTIVVDENGRFICCRKSLVPWRNVMWIYNPVLTSSIFLHRRVLEQQGLFFDTRWHMVADFFWEHEIVQRRLRMAVLRRFTSVFTDTGENLCLTPEARREQQTKMQMAPAWVRRLSWPLFQLHRARQVCRGIYWQKPFTYSIYTRQNPDHRVDFLVDKPTSVWRNRH
jgi:glycosyltransferase involved in cell wall biosynthesis